MTSYPQLTIAIGIKENHFSTVFHPGSCFSIFMNATPLAYTFLSWIKRTVSFESFATPYSHKICFPISDWLEMNRKDFWVSLFAIKRMLLWQKPQLPSKIINRFSFILQRQRYSVLRKLWGCAFRTAGYCNFFSSRNATKNYWGKNIRLKGYCLKRFLKWT